MFKHGNGTLKPIRQAWENATFGQIVQAFTSLCALKLYNFQKLRIFRGNAKYLLTLQHGNGT